MAKAELGVKRSCLSCNMRFYDFNRNPIICPGCGAEFDLENLIKSSRSPGAPRAKPKVGAPVTQHHSNDSALIYGEDSNTTKEDDTDIDMDFVEDDVDDKDGPGVIPDHINHDDELLPNLNDTDE